MEDLLETVSVVITCYNQGQYLEECINSVTNSDYPNIEIILVDDGSEDTFTQKTLDKLDSGKIKIIRQNNQGVCAARNNGIAAATGKYILPLDADDKIAETYISKAVKILAENPQIGIVLCNGILWASQSGGGGKWKLSSPTIINMLIQNCIFSSAIFRKSDFEKTGGFNPVMEAGCEDWDLWLKFLENGLKPYKIDEELFYYRVAENFRSKNAIRPQNYIKIRYNIIKLHKKLYLKYSFIVALPLMFMILKNILSFAVKKRVNIRNALKEYISSFKYRLQKPGYGLNTPKRDKKLIVTLTSFPERIKEVHLGITTLLNQTLKPDMIILWLAEEEFPKKEKDLPPALLNLQKYGLTIRWCENLKSYKKIIPALLEYPEDILVTADDDLFYRKDWLELLYNSYTRNPNVIHCHRMKEISIKKEGQNSTVKYLTANVNFQDENKTYIATSGAGILFPPHTLYKESTRSELFLKLAPQGDDLWLWAMAELNNKKVKLVDGHITQLYYINPFRDYELVNAKTLYSSNKLGMNDTQMQSILEYYPVLHKKLQEKKRIKCLKSV